MANLTVRLQEQNKLSMSLRESEQLSLGLRTPAIPRDYERLTNLPRINGVQLIGDMAVSDLRIISENTVSGWAAMPNYVPKRGEVCVYTDAEMVERDGQTISIPKIKIGDGSAYIVDLPFVAGEGYSELKGQLDSHMSDDISHVTQAERAFWNAKLNYAIADDNLVFTRL